MTRTRDAFGAHTGAMAQTHNGTVLMQNAAGHAWTIIPLESGARVVPRDASRPAFELSPHALTFFIAINNLNATGDARPQRCARSQ
jgi:hypothetical protein